MQWRLILHPANDAFSNMAIDEALLRKGIPTLRFYTWKPSAISIGYFQCIEDEVNLEECKRQRVDVVRRITGGGAVYHDENGEITYSIVCPQNMLPQNIMDSYSIICSSIAHGLKYVGIKAEHAGINDIIVNDKKISGSAQTRRYGNVLQHGTILLKVNVKKMFSLLKVSKEKISDKQIKRAEERVTSIENEIGEISKEEVINAIMRGFREKMKIKFFEGKMDEKEKELAEKLRVKYESKEWNFKR
ncbi:MAG: lipoate--protein ligase family protein [Thermoplasmata archaeon]|nr:MAG: lipoate--protein ligase family protein [Thermoplasmata archaeon]